MIAHNVGRDGSICLLDGRCVIVHGHSMNQGPNWHLASAMTISANARTSRRLAKGVRYKEPLLGACRIRKSAMISENR